MSVKENNMDTKAEIFLSYCWADETIADEIYDYLVRNNFRSYIWKKADDWIVIFLDVHYLNLCILISKIFVFF